MASDDEKVDVLQAMFHALDLKVERILALMEGRKERDEDVEKRLKAVETQTAENANALRIVKWLGGAAFGIVSVAAAYLIQLGIDTMRQLVSLLHR